jgi:hypothetical protein
VIKTIVTTTINPPSKAINLFAKKEDWNLIIVGDLITPHILFRKLEKKYKNTIYLSPEDQDRKYPKLSKTIGWRKIQRRNIGYIEAYNQGAEVIATVDDDNISLKGWGENLLIGKNVEVNYYNTKLESFDPIGATNYPNLWHRGYPLQLISKRNYSQKIKKEIVPDIQADFWDGDPDIDAICRMEHAPECKFDSKYFPIASNKISPFDSQNTFLSRKAIKDYFLFPDVGRMDDIWASFYVQAEGYKVVYNKASVYQQRNIHDLTKDMKAEYLGYEHNLEIIQNINDCPEVLLKYLPKQALIAFELYKKYFDR